MVTGGDLRTGEGRAGDGAGRRVLVVTELFPRRSNAFLGTFVVNQLEALSHRHDLTVITAHAPSLRDPFAPRLERRCHGRIEVHSIRYFPLWLWALTYLRWLSYEAANDLCKRLFARRLRRLASRLHAARPFDLVHGHEVFLGDEAGPLGEHLGIRSCFTLHGLHAYHQQTFGSRVVAAAMANLAKVDHVIGVSRLALDSYAKAGARFKVSSVVPNCTRIQEGGTGDRRIRDFALGRPVLLTVGFFAREKRVQDVILALRKLVDSGQDPVLVLIGKGPLEPELRDLVEGLGLGRRVLFLGVVTPSEMGGQYAQADILVSASEVESFSMVCLEALTLGKPVVCTSAIGICEYFEVGEGLLTFPAGDPGALHDRLLHLLTHPASRSELVQKAQRGLSRCAIPMVSEAITRIYESTPEP